ncbi:MAG: hypothetical protein LBB50_04060, partial [Oscillospiraceae bacterium]|nr:hypothetical protein [Oscillospiraceae bacterium]
MKRILSVLLVACMLCGALAMGASAAEPPVPVIKMTAALGHLYFNAGDVGQYYYDPSFVDKEYTSHLLGQVMGTVPTGKWTGPPEDPSASSELVVPERSLLDAIASSAGDLLPALQKLDFKPLDAFLDLIFEQLGQGLERGFGPISFSPDGESRLPLDGDMLSKKRNIEYAANGRRDLWFNYDWRESPVIIADEFFDFIEAVKQASGSKKVNVFAPSGSCAVLLAYLDKVQKEQRENSIDRIFMSVSMAKGLTGFGELVTASPKINIDSLASPAFFGSLRAVGLDLGDSLDGVLSILKTLADIGAAQPVNGVLALLLQKKITKFFNDYLVPTALSLPMFWSYVSDSYYDEGIKGCFGGKPEYAGLVKKLDAYYKIQVRSEEILRAAADSGVSIGMMASFGLPMLLPFGKDSTKQSDALANTTLASFGATTSDVGGVLKGKLGGLQPYKQAKTACGHNHISPDRTVDASTCLFPETTWFVAGVQHMENGRVEDLSGWFFDSPEAPTVHTDEENRPQFRYFVREDGKYVRVDPPAPAELT